MVAVVRIISRYGFKIETHRRNQSNKTKHVIVYYWAVVNTYADLATV